MAYLVDRHPEDVTATTPQMDSSTRANQGTLPEAMAETSELFPLDISYGEISLWLANRRKLSADWIRRLREIQSRSAKAFASLPVAFASQFEATEEGSVEYVTAIRIRDALAETAERGYFGGLSGEAAVWDKIVKSYEKGNLYLGEAGQRILKNVDYEVPFLKKKMEALDKRAVELGRRVTECEHSAAVSASAFGKECQELGVRGIDLPQEFTALGDRVYEILQKGFDGLQREQIRKAVDFYRAMSQELHGKGQKALPMVQKVFDNGIEAPTSDQIKEIQQPSLPPPTAQLPNEDLGAGGVIEEAEISWDIIIEEDTVEEGEPVEGVGVEWEEDTGIDWEIEVAPTTTADPLESPPPNEIPTPEMPIAVKSVQEASAAVLRFIWDLAFRHALLDDLYELHSFLTVRSLADASDAVSLTLSDVLRKYDPSETQGYLTQLQAVLDSFVSDSSQRCLMLKTSGSYRERLMTEFLKKSRREGEWKKQAVQAEQERNSVQTELQQLSIQLDHICRQTRDLKLLVEQGISPLFQNRSINIMGKINTVLLPK